MKRFAATQSVETLNYIAKHFSLSGEIVLRDGKPIRTRATGGKAPYRKVHIRYVREAGRRRKIVWKLSRLKFYLATGEIPETVDHKSGDTRDDTLANLRAATTAQNNQNRRAKAGKRGGLRRGVTETATGKFRVRIGHEGKKIHVGTFASEAEAVAARNAAEKPLKGEWHRPMTRRKAAAKRKQMSATAGRNLNLSARTVWRPITRST